MTKPKHLPDVELPRSQRLNLAVAAYRADQAANQSQSIRSIAKQFGVPWTSLRGRVNEGMAPKQVEAQNRQRLTPMEEEVLVQWCLQIEEWGWPARINQLKKMATELLKAKGDTTPLGVNWQHGFLNRHHQLKSAFTDLRDNDRYLAEDYSVFADFFDLYKRTKERYKIHEEDIYNMDEKGFMMGVIGSTRCVVSRGEKKPIMVQDGSREWTTVIECVSILGRLIKAFIIFKGKVFMKKWTFTMEEIGEPFSIALSENGWVDNELGSLWLKDCFNKETKNQRKGEYRMLLFDGHGSHITTEAIKFCRQENIIPLCLPPHTTHLLQPCDVGLFGPLSVLYKNSIQERTRFGAGYYIDKCDFLEVYFKVRHQAISHSNIASAWRETGIYPWDPTIVLSKLKDPQVLCEAPLNLDTPPTTRPSTSNSVVTAKTPANIAQLKAIVLQAKQGILTNTIALEKICKTASIALADAIIAKATNEAIIENEKLRARKKKRGNGIETSKARVLGDEVLEERRLYAIEQAWNGVRKEFNHMTLDIYMWELPQKRPPSPTKIRRDFEAAIKPLLRLGPELFAVSKSLSSKQIKGGKGEGRGRGKEPQKGRVEEPLLPKEPPKPKRRGKAILGQASEQLIAPKEVVYTSRSGRRCRPTNKL